MIISRFSGLQEKSLLQSIKRMGGEKWYVFVSGASRPTLKSHIAHHAGHAYVKAIFDPFGKCMTVILGKNEPINGPSDNKWSRYLSKFSDVIITIESLPELANI